MKILYLSMAYNKNGDGLATNLVDAILNRKHAITVVRADINKEQVEEISTYYKILSVKTGDPFENNFIKKGINQVCLAKKFKKAIKKHLQNETYDLILYATPPITLYSVIKYCKNCYKAKTYLMLKDIFPQNAVDLDLFSSKSMIYKYFRKKEKLYYQISDKIGCMSQGNVDYLIKHNPYIDKNKVEIFYNSIRVDEHSHTHFNENKTVFIFGGSLGKPQNIPFLLDVIYQLRDYTKASFTIIGKGAERNRVIEFIENNNLSNLSYYDFLPSQEYEKVLEKADVGLISLDHRFTIPNIPSKFQFYLRQRKPVLAITDRHTDLKDMILNNECGWWSESNDINNAVKLIKKITENKQTQIEKGENGFAYFIKNFDVENNVDAIERFMKENDNYEHVSG